MMTQPEIILYQSADSRSSGVDFDDAEYGFKEEDKSSIKVSWMISASLWFARV